MQNNCDDINTILSLVFSPGDVFEVRCLDATTPDWRKEHTEAGYFTFENIDKAIGELNRISARGVYFTPNPVHPDLLARSANRFQAAKRNAVTTDADILCRRWLLIDCDPVRRSGISSTDDEHDAALYKAIEVSEKLKAQGWPEPVMLDSGNGAQLMYRIDLPANDDGLVKACLQALAPMGDDKVSIDQAVFNPARIWRLSGTMNRKGDEVDDRVYRMAKIISPLDLSPEIVPVEKLRALAGTASAPVKEIIPNDTTFYLDAWIAEHCPEADGPVDWKDGRKWVFPVCPFNEAHDNRSAVIIQQANGAIGFKCHHNGCINNDWHALRELKGDAKKQPENLPAVDLSGILAQNKPEEELPVDSDKPWRHITNDQIEKLLQGTVLGEMVHVFRSVSRPLLPLEGGLMKAIVLAGCALSERNLEQTTLSSYIQNAHSLARLVIDTAGGQVCNVYGVLVAETTSGKDIGNLMDLIAKKYYYLVGNAGSAEGIADTFQDASCSNDKNKAYRSLMNVTELVNWLDKGHWQYKATGFITDAFNKGCFEQRFSKKMGGPRYAQYCFPNIMANVQADILETHIDKNQISSGFLGRFIFCNMPDLDVRPAKIDVNACLEKLSACVDLFRKKRGVLQIPENYLDDLFNMFKNKADRQTKSSWKRLVNEYGPRLAVMLSVTLKPETQGPDVVLTNEVWDKTRILVQWFFAHSERIILNIKDCGGWGKEQERQLKKIFNIIRGCDKGKGVLRRTISQRSGGSGTDAEMRLKMLNELIDREIIQFDIGTSRYSVKRVPPEWKE